MKGAAGILLGAVALVAGGAVALPVSTGGAVVARILSAVAAAGIAFVAR